MKVLIATPYFYPMLGGLENYARNIAEGLKASGCDVVVVCGDPTASGVTRTSVDGYTVWRLPVWRVVSNTPVNFGWFGMLRQILRFEQPDVINAHTPVPFMVDMVTWAAGSTPVVVTYHAATLFKPSSFLMRLATSAYLGVQKLTLTRAKAIIAVSPYVKAQFSKKLAGKTVVVGNAVAAVKPARSQAGTGLVFVNNLGRTHRWKGLDLILESLAQLKREGIATTLTVIGDGDDRKRYEQRVADLGLKDMVSFVGAYTGEARDRYIREAMAAVIYSTTANDAFPTVMLEYWSQGTAVVAAAIGPLPSLVDDGKTGVLAKPNDAVALAKTLKQVLADPDATRQMGEAGRQLVEAEYTWPKQVGRTYSVLREVVS